MRKLAQGREFSHGALNNFIVVAEGALEHLVKLRVSLHNDLLRALLSTTHGFRDPTNSLFARGTPSLICLFVPTKEEKLKSAFKES